MLQVYENYRSTVPKLIYDALKPDEALTKLSDAQIMVMAKPDATDWEIRKRVLKLLSGPIKSDKKPHLEEDFYDGITTERTFRIRIENPYKAHFLTRPLHKFQHATDNLLLTLTSRFYEIASLPITNEHGDTNQANAALVMSMTKLLLDRKYGSSIKKVMVAGSKTIIKSPKEIDDEIKALEAEFRDEQKQREVSGVPTGKEEDEGAATVSGERGADGVQPT